MDPYPRSVEKIRAWLAAHFDATGQCTIDPADLRYYYKTPYLLTMVGLRSRGSRVARHVFERFVDADGRLWHPRPGNDQNAPLHARLSYSSDCAMTVCALAGR